MKRIIVTRFSAMGDVAMVASVLQAFQQQHQDTELIMVSRSTFAAFFSHIPRLKFHAIQPKGRHKGIFGLFSLFNELKVYKADAYADLHNNLRSRFLDFLFRSIGVKLRVIDKGRKEKNELTRAEHKIKKQLKLTTERYADVFRELGFPIQLDHQLQKEYRLIPAGMMPILASAKKKIGIAAFAQHPYKVLPKEKMQQVILDLAKEGHEILLFGGGDQEQQLTEIWAANHSNVHSMVGKYKLAEELDIISHLDLMISMDSSGMHMASLVGTRCLSVWGATHPYAGFMGYGQADADAVQVEHPNRPSSVYGNKPCICDGKEAIDLISPEMIVQKAQLMLG